MDDILKTLTDLIRDLFDEYDGPVTRQLTATSVPQWDSLGHVQFMVLIEQVFGIRFNADEIGKFKNLGELIDAIAKKRGTSG